MSEEECDLEALLDVLDEDDLPNDNEVETDKVGPTESTNEANNEPEEDEEEEIQRQLLEMEAKMRAMKEKLNRKNNKSPAAARQASVADPPAKTSAASGATAAPRASVAVTEVDVFRNVKSCINIF
jgi:hypothetical protein